MPQCLRMETPLFHPGCSEVRTPQHVCLACCAFPHSLDSFCYWNKAACRSWYKLALKIASKVSYDLRQNRTSTVEKRELPDFLKFLQPWPAQSAGMIRSDWSISKWWDICTWSSVRSMTIARLSNSALFTYTLPVFWCSSSVFSTHI